MKRLLINKGLLYFKINKLVKYIDLNHQMIQNCNKQLISCDNKKNLKNKIIEFYYNNLFYILV